jgi:hypothetical protein
VVSKVIVVAVAGAFVRVVIVGVFVLFILQGFYTRDSRSLIAFKD